MKRLVLALVCCVLLSPAVSVVATELPRTAAELNRWYVEPPTNQNAATYVLQGIAALNITVADHQSYDLPWLGWAKPPLPGTPVPAAMNNAVADVLSRNRSALPFFREAAKCEQSRYPLNFTDEVPAQEAKKSKHLEGLMNATFIWNLYTLWLANENQGAEGAKVVAMNLALARTLEPEPDLGSQIRRAACIGWTIEGLEQVINRSTLPPESLNQLQAVLDRMENRESAGVGFTRGLIGWRVFHETMIFPVERQLVGETYDDLLRAWIEPYPGRIKSVNEIGSARAKTAKERGFHFSPQWIADAVDREGNGLAFLRLARTAVALERYRAAHRNVYPRSLGELKPDYLAEIPLDPFDGKPLRYHRNATGYFLHSIGEDLTDNLGVRQHSNEQDTGPFLAGDVVFNVVAPPRAMPAVPMKSSGAGTNQP